MLALRDAPRPRLPEAPAPGPDDAAHIDAAIVCAACLGGITSSRHGIAVNGSHDHRFMNPGGFLFHIGCFAEAVGCVIVGPASTELPWFPGLAWRLAYCGHCRVHLGWHFRGAGSAFFGLVLDRLRQPSARG